MLHICVRKCIGGDEEGEEEEEEEVQPIAFWKLQMEVEAGTGELRSFEYHYYFWRRQR